MDLYARQVALEDEYSTSSIVAGQEAVINALQQGRIGDIGAGKLLLAKAYDASVQAFKEYLSKPTRGLGGKYKALLKIADPEVLVMAGLREVLNACAAGVPVTLQSTLSHLGRAIESESILAFMDTVSPEYTKRTVEYLDTVGTKSVHHRYRTFLKGGERLGIQWEAWSSNERVQAARLLCTILYDNTGLFLWRKTVDTDMYYIEPSPELKEHFQEMLESARAIVKYPPMLIQPLEWTGQYDGGYLTDWFRHNAPMCSIRYLKREHRKWILSTLESPTAAPVRSAMNKSQSVGYRVNTKVLSVLRKAVALRTGILGLPSSVPAPKPQFPFGESWDKTSATPEDLEQFSYWKKQMANWYTLEAKRVGRSVGVLGYIEELVRYKDEEALYFPTFIDWRGRLYFRSKLNPQSFDAVKGCLEFSNGVRLGSEGLFWLKVHVANSCGYDKHSPELKVQWLDENWEAIQNFLDNPYDVDAPDPETAFTLLQAGYALQDALSLDNPEDYVCHVPVAMDATCSGLQHFSALTRDPIGAYHTNLIDNNKEQKSDIYVQVADVAKGIFNDTEDDVNVLDFWSTREITRNMAKNPVMVYVYGAKLINNIDTLALQLSEVGVQPIEADGKILYSINRLATPVAKALRAGVEQTVPAATEMMKYLQRVVRSKKTECLRWVSPVGVPVVNWSDKIIKKRLDIRSMGVVNIQYLWNSSEYCTRSAADGISPNFVHSMDSSHLCMTVNAFEYDIQPIHDSFACHAAYVSDMHRVIRETFVELYQGFNIEDVLQFNEVDTEELPVPVQGLFDLETVLDAPYMFG